MPLDADHSFPWHGEFTPDEFAVVRAAIPAAVHASQQRSARAHIEYGDPDGDQYVYGAGMSRGVQKELARGLAGLACFRVETVKGTTRKLMFVGEKLIFPIRVGTKMPRNHRRVRIPYMPDVHRDLFAASSVTKYDEPGLFEIPADTDGDETARLEDALGYLANTVSKESLFVPYYSSTPDGVGSLYWAPAKLSGKNYLQFSDPERLAYMTTAVDVPKISAKSQVQTFADGQRPRTSARLRTNRSNPEEK